MNIADRGCFTIEDAAAAGISKSQLRSRRFVTPLRGVRSLRTVAEQLTWSDLVREAHAAAAGEHQFFSHTTAAKLHGMPLPGRFRDERIVHVASPEGGNRSRKPHMIGHRLRAEVVEVDGVRAECVVDTIVHLATLLRTRELVVVIDWAVSAQRESPVTREDILRRLDDFRGARGIGRIKRALELARVGAESPRESLLRLVAIDAGFAELELNIDVFDADGTFVARLDMAWVEAKIALEYDGEQHRTNDRQFARDIDRLEALARIGWIVIRVTKVHMRDPAQHIIPRLAAAFARRH